MSRLSQYAGAAAAILLTWQVAALAAPRPSELDGKIVVGYQGWFGCGGDAGGSGWMHWQAQDGGLHVEMLPDLSELPAQDVCVFQPKRGGAPVQVYSSANPDVIDLHVRWMAQYGISVAAVQRFVAVLKSPAQLAFSDRVLDRARYAAEQNGRSFFVEYDLTGSTPADTARIVDNIRQLGQAGFFTSPAYQKVRGRPLIGFWGLGFNGRPWAPPDALALVAQARGAAGPASVLAGVPAYWRTGTHDASSDPGWQEVWRKIDVLTPWTVGRFGDDRGAASFDRDVMAPDAEWAARAGLIYLPTAFPGFSWSNADPTHARNEIPRRCGTFLRAQLDGIRRLGLRSAFVAMFDEVDEGTAIYKTLPHRSQHDVLVLDADGCNLASDFYLALVRDEARAFRLGRTQ